MPFVLPSRPLARPLVRINVRSRARHRMPRQSILLLVASITGLMALALAVIVSLSGFFA